MMAAFIPAALIIYNGLHMVPEGHVGVYYRGGALLNTYTDPGYHTQIPLLTTVQYV